MGSIDERAVPFRLRMVHELAEMGISDPVVLDALLSVPRHRFVDQFWATRPGMAWTPENVRAYRVDDHVDDHVDDQTLDLIYRTDIALATRGGVDRSAATSSLSAPIIVALMLGELDLRPGVRVLEIGTGSGYHAALMAELVGDPALVTSVDIDQVVIADAVGRLDQLGYCAMTVRCGDGAFGAVDRAPFDRIVATVGCADLAPAWVGQLAPGGRMLVPLEHGGAYPRVLAWRDDGLVGRFVGHSSFVRIQGRQAGCGRRRAEVSWPELAAVGPAPSALLAALAPPDPTQRWRTPGRWDFSIYLAIRDRRAIPGPGLAEDGSIAGVRDSELVVHGDRGPALKERFLDIAADWLLLGSPTIRDYALTFTSVLARQDDPLDSPTGPWPVDRLDHRQTVALSVP